MRCKKCQKTTKHANRYRHWRENQLCSICDHGGNGRYRRLRYEKTNNLS